MTATPWKGKIVLDTIAQFQTLSTTGTLVIDGVTITYDPNHYDYWVKEETQSETWKLIEDYTITEDAVFERTQWLDNGTTKYYNFKKLQVGIKIPVLSATYNTNFIMIMDKTAPSARIYGYLPALGRTAGPTNSRIFCDSAIGQNGISPYFQAIPGTSAANHTYTYFFGITDWLLPHPSYWPDFNGYIRGFRFGSPESPIPSGTRVIIYGVEGE